MTRTDFLIDLPHRFESTRKTTSNSLFPLGDKHRFPIWSEWFSKLRMKTMKSIIFNLIYFGIGLFPNHSVIKKWRKCDEHHCGSDAIFFFLSFSIFTNEDWRKRAASIEKRREILLPFFLIFSFSLSHSQSIDWLIHVTKRNTGVKSIDPWRVKDKGMKLSRWWIVASPTSKKWKGAKVSFTSENVDSRSALQAENHLDQRLVQLNGRLFDIDVPCCSKRFRSVDDNDSNCCCFVLLFSSRRLEWW